MSVLEMGLDFQQSNVDDVILETYCDLFPDVIFENYIRIIDRVVLSSEE